MVFDCTYAQCRDEIVSSTTQQPACTAEADTPVIIMPHGPSRYRAEWCLIARPDLLSKLWMMASHVVHAVLDCSKFTTLWQDVVDSRDQFE